MGTAPIEGKEKERKSMRVTSSMIESLPVSVVDAYRLARRPQPFETWRRPSARPPIEKKRDDAFVPQPLYAPVPQPPEPAPEPRDEAPAKPQRGVVIYEM
jgi:hypothetical protein